MPQCQFPVFCCFCVLEKLHRKYSRSWTKRSPKFLLSRHETESKVETEEGTEVATPPGREGAPLAAPPPGVGPLGDPLTSPLRLYKASDAKTLNQSAFSQIKFCSAAAVEDQFWGVEVSVPAPCWDGEVPSEPSPSTPSTPPPSPSTLLSPMMKRE
jgi:hypothetical protein